MDYTNTTRMDSETITLSTMINFNTTLAANDDEMVYGLEEAGGPIRPGVQISAWLVPLLFGLITICGVVGNLLVIYVICRHGSMKTVTNYYIINLAITDIAFLVCCAPFTASLYAVPEWIFGRFLCKFVFYMMQVSLSGLFSLCIAPYKTYPEGCRTKVTLRVILRKH